MEAGEDWEGQGEDTFLCKVEKSKCEVKSREGAEWEDMAMNRE